MNEWEQLFNTVEGVFSNVASLLQDVERMLATHGYVVDHKIKSTIGAEQSYSVASPSWWFPGWVSRHFVHPSGSAGRSIFVSVLLHARKGDDFAKLDEPVVTAAVLHVEGGGSWQYSMGKMWARTNPRLADGTPTTMEVSLKTGRVRVVTFAYPLASMTDAVVLERKIVDPLVRLGKEWEVDLRVL